MKAQVSDKPWEKTFTFEPAATLPLRFTRRSRSRTLRTGR